MGIKKSFGIMSVCFTLYSTTLLAEEYKILFDKIEKPFESLGEPVVNEPILPDWIFTEDTCGGLRQSSFESSVYYARANTSTRNTSLSIPSGYHWATHEEYTTLIPSVMSGDVYSGKCGIPSGYPKINGVEQWEFMFSNTMSTGISIHVGVGEGQAMSVWDEPNNFAGYVLIKD